MKSNRKQKKKNCEKTVFGCVRLHPVSGNSLTPTSQKFTKKKKIENDHNNLLLRLCTFMILNLKSVGPSKLPAKNVFGQFFLGEFRRGLIICGIDVGVIDNSTGPRLSWFDIYLISRCRNFYNFYSFGSGTVLQEKTKIPSLKS